MAYLFCGFNCKGNPVVNSKRGFTGLEIAGVVAIVGLVIMFAPKLNPFSNAADPANRRTASAISGRDVVEITNAVANSDKPVTVRVDRSMESSEEITDPKLTLGQRVGRFFSGLGTWGLILVALCIFTPLGGAIWKWWSYRTAFKNTVAGIRDIEDPEAYQKAVRSIAIQQNKRDKVLVDRMKSELH